MPRRPAPAVGYVRVSTDEQETSVTAQRVAIQRYATAKGLHLARVFVDEGVSGSKAFHTRYGGQQLQCYVDDYCTEVIAVRLDRLFRSDVDSTLTRAAWTAQGVTLHLVDEGGAVGQTAQDALTLSIRSALAEYERANISARVTRGIREAKARGVRMGSAPFGWRKGAPDVHGVRPLEPYGPEQIIIRRIVADKDAGVSYRQLARRLEAETGEAWTATRVRRVYLRATAP